MTRKEKDIHKESGAGVIRVRVDNGKRQKGKVTVRKRRSSTRRVVFQQRGHGWGILEGAFGHVEMAC